MKHNSSDIIILGGGLTGLTLAYLLRAQEVKVHILEAKERLGGRIYTKYPDNLAPQEMGATWLGKKHTALVALLAELQLGMFEQRMEDRAIYEAISTSPPQLVTLPHNPEPSYRIQGGTSRLIEALTNQLEGTEIFTGQIVEAIEKTAEGFQVNANLQTFTAPILVSTLPPHLLTQKIQFTPALPDALLAVASQTHTWMGESIKVSLTYEAPFWRAPNLSGTLFSNAGPITEMYDHSNVEDNTYALKGFLNGAYYAATKEERLAVIMGQLRKYYGPQIEKFVTYEEAIWREDPFVFFPYPAHVLPHQNNGHELYRRTYLDGKFFVAGSETAAQFPGYMEGAVRSANFVAKALTAHFSVSQAN